MGKVKRLLAKGTIPPAPDMYAATRSIECAETMHIHERNLRLEYTLDELTEFKRALERAWQKIGLAIPKEGQSTKWLDVADIGDTAGVTPQRFEVEESEYPTLPETTIHIHYRSFRLELTHSEWKEFASVIGRAWETWKK